MARIQEAIPPRRRILSLLLEGSRWQAWPFSLDEAARDASLTPRRDEAERTMKASMDHVIASAEQALREGAASLALRIVERAVWAGLDGRELQYLRGISMVNAFGLLDFGPGRTVEIYEAAQQVLRRAADRGHAHAVTVGRSLEPFESIGCMSALEAMARWLAGYERRYADGVPLEPRAVFVDDLVPLGRWFQWAARRTRWKVTVLEDPRDAEGVIAQESLVDVLLVDDLMPHQSGIEVIKSALRRTPDLRVIFMSSGDPDLARDAVEAGATAVARKPFDDGSMLVALVAALELKAPGELLPSP